MKHNSHNQYVVDIVNSIFDLKHGYNHSVLLDITVFLLFIKYIDESFFNRQLQPIIHDEKYEKYSWSKWIKQSHNDQKEFMLNNLLPYFNSIYNTHPEISEFFEEASSVFSKNEFYDIANKINYINLVSLDNNDKQFFFEELFNRFQKSKQEPILFRLPRTIRRLLVFLVNPKAGDSIVDLTCGSGSLLYEANSHVSEASTVSLKNSLNMYGFDVSKQSIRIAILQKYIYGVESAHFKRIDVLKEYDDQKIVENFDAVVSSFPLGMRIPSSELSKSLPSLQITDAVFLYEAMYALKNGGRAGVIVPGSLLWSEQQGIKEIREDLIRHFKVDYIISLPSNMYEFTKLPIFMIVFENTQPSDTHQVKFLDFSSISIDLLNNPDKLNTLIDRLKDLQYGTEKPNDAESILHNSKASTLALLASGLALVPGVGMLGIAAAGATADYVKGLIGEDKNESIYWATTNKIITTNDFNLNLNLYKSNNPPIIKPNDILDNMVLNAEKYLKQANKVRDVYTNIQNTIHGMINIDFKTVTLNELCDIVPGKKLPGTIEKILSGDVNVVKYKDITQNDGYMLKATSSKISFDDLKNNTQIRLIPERSLLLGWNQRQNDVVVATDREVVIDDWIKALIVDHSKVNYWYLFSWMKNYLKESIKQQVGNPFSGRSTESLKNLQIILPPLSIQDLYQELMQELNKLMIVSKNMGLDDTVLHKAFLDSLSFTKEMKMDTMQTNVNDQDLERQLRSVGKGTFVECYEIFEALYRNPSREQLIQVMFERGGAKHLSSARTKANVGARIFEQALEIKALKNIISSDKVDKNMREKAQRLLKENLQ
jgi:type I restriction enzyme M protein